MDQEKNSNKYMQMQYGKGIEGRSEKARTCDEQTI